MTPSRQAPSIDGRWGAADPEGDAGTLAALLRLPPGDEVDDARVLAVIAATGFAAGRTPQRSPSLANRAVAWLRGLAHVGEGGWWRFGVPAAVALVLGILAGNASVDRYAGEQTVAINVETLVAPPRTLETFGL